MKRKTAVALAAAAFALPVALSLAPAAHADTVVMQNQPAGVLSLSAQASADVPQDVVNITLFYEQEAKDPASLTDALNQRADAALKQAKGVSGVTARTGSFSIYPSTDRDGRISAWRGRTEVVLESRDFAAASKLAGQMSSNMQVGNVAFSLSPEAQRAAEEKLSAQAIASFRQQATASAQAFGYSGYTIREVKVGQNGIPPRPMMMSMRAPVGADAKAAAPVPIEGGTSTVTVNVSGSVQMTR
ncbi:SIMPL domain-containing protein [Trinickia mobilis]|uniref:SIMPL domain-containing protein n=1 Tax=Trinickia mobilis TaxID=2816356 RepID=UPI001A8F977A|nr:SIMPL domain-containing protein [Trinickia mobilis]